MFTHLDHATSSSRGTNWPISMTVYLMDGRALVEQQEQWTANRRFIFLFPSSRASRSCRAPREISRSPRLAHKAPVMQASECTLYSVTPVTLFSTMKRVTGVTQKQPKKRLSRWIHTKKTSKLSLLYLFYSNTWKQWYLAFADLYFISHTKSQRSLVTRHRLCVIQI